MISTNIDLGQIILGSLIGFIGYFVKRTVDQFDSRITKHESILFVMNGDIKSIMGQLGVERRSHVREAE